jgi:two-component system chemotaxis response regulator CheB
MKPITVLIIDDSALVRKMLTEILQTDPGIEVVGTAVDPYDAREKIKKLNPDVLTLDVEMPKMDGVTFLDNLMRLHPMPVVMVSSLTEKGADVTLRALELGAVDFVNKPKIDIAHSLDQYTDEIISKLKNAAGSKVTALTRRTHKNRPSVDKKLSADAIIGKQRNSNHFTTTESIIAIGASTGGTEAIKDVLMALPANTAGTVITQHIPAAFSAKFAERMDGICEMKVCEAFDGQNILPGHVYIAPGDQHLMIKRSGARYHCKLSNGPAVNRHKPSVDVLFRSAAQNAGANAIGVLLTGMGDDGAKGLKELQEVGAMTIAQDEVTSVVWGMPGAAVKLGAADQILPLYGIADALLAHKQVGKKYGT